MNKFVRKRRDGDYPDFVLPRTRLGNLSKLDAPGNAGGLNSGDVLAHEAMDAYYSLSMGAEAADYAAAALFPGLLMPTNVQIDRTSGVLFGQTSD